MVRTVLTSLLCSLVFAAQTYSQDVFVPRELKAQAVHPPAVKEHPAETKAPTDVVVRRAEPVTEADLKAPAPKEPASRAESVKSKTPKADLATAKTEKAPSKEKSSASAKVEKAPAAKEEPATKTVAKTETVKAEPSKEKAEKPAAVKEKAVNSTTAKTQPAKTDSATAKIEKAVPVKAESASKAMVKSEPVKAELPKEKSPASAKEKVASESTAKAQTVKSDAAAVAKTEKAPAAKDEATKKTVVKTESVKVETVTAKTEKAPVKDKPAIVAAAKTQKEEKTNREEPASKTVAKTEKPATVKDKPATVAMAKTQPAKPEVVTGKVETPRPPAEGPITVSKTTTVKAEQVSVPSQKDPPQILPAISGSLETGFTKIADGFDFPVGKPEAEGYYKARGFRAGGHVGEDWDGVRGGDTDLNDPIYCIGDGIVVFARDVHLGWGNVIIVRHAYRDGGTVKYIDALYGHLNTMLVGRGQRVSRGQQIATMGTAHGQYDAHLHFEIRKNLEIGMSRSKFEKNFSNYYDPSQFIASHRHLSGGGANYKVAMNTFTHDWTYHFDSNRNFSSRKRSTGESSAALRRAVTSR